MRMRQRARQAAWLVLGFVIGSILFAFCASCTPPQLYEGHAVATLTVDNDNFNDVAVYIAHSNTPARKLEGYVPGKSKKFYLLLDSDFSGGMFQLFAKFVGDGAIISEPIAAVPGAHYMWQLNPARGSNFLYQQRS